MSENSRKKILYTVLAAAVLWGIYNFVPSSKESTNTSSKPAVSQIAPAAVIGTQSSIDKTIDIADMRLKGWGSDPFKAKKKNRAKKSRPKKIWKLSGIVFNETNPMAIINGKSIGVGDIIGGARILKIGRRKVVIEYSGKSISLTVSKG